MLEEDYRFVPGDRLRGATQYEQLRAFDVDLDQRRLKAVRKDVVEPGGGHGYRANLLARRHLATPQPRVPRSGHDVVEGGLAGGVGQGRPTDLDVGALAELPLEPLAQFRNRLEAEMAAHRRETTHLPKHRALVGADVDPVPVVRQPDRHEQPHRVVVSKVPAQAGVRQGAKSLEVILDTQRHG
jgi:hypothetical protein